MIKGDKIMAKGKADSVNNNPEVIMEAVISFLTVFMPITLVKRLLSLVLIAADIDNENIHRLTGYGNSTIRKLRSNMHKKSIQDILVIRGGGRKAKSTGVESEILSELEHGNYHTRQQVADMIKDKFGISMSVSAVGKLLKKNGFKKLKCGSLPAKADTAAQYSFYNDVLHPLMKEAEDGKLALLFMDASHFVLGCDYLGCIYCRVRRFVKTFSGRKRYNVLGAMDFVTKRVLTVTNDTYITATEVCNILRIIAHEYPEQAVYLILDNARYQKCEAVQKLASELGITLQYIPAYSPNLNLIERLWKFVKGELRSNYYDNFCAFQNKIDTIIESTTKENHQKIEKLIGENVHLFDGMKTITNNTLEPLSCGHIQAA